MFTADIIALDDQVVVSQAEITGQGFPRGEGSMLWRGYFHIPENAAGRVKMGDTLYLLLRDRSRVGTVVTEVAESLVHFRARGRLPRG
jgi:hypothetical protein